MAGRGPTPAVLNTTLTLPDSNTLAGVMKLSDTQNQEARGEGPKPLPKVRSGDRLLGPLAWSLNSIIT